MKTVVQATAALLLLATSAFGAKWTKTGGTTEDPAPKGSYTGTVSRKASGDTITWRVTTATGVLEIDSTENGLSEAEKEALAAAELQNDKNNTVEIDKNGRVESVSTG